MVEKGMNKVNFEELTGILTTIEEYKKIELVFFKMNGRWRNLKEFTDFFKLNNGMEAIDLLYNVCINAKILEEQIKANENKLKEYKILYCYDY